MDGNVGTVKEADARMVMEVDTGMRMQGCIHRDADAEVHTGMGTEKLMWGQGQGSEHGDKEKWMGEVDKDGEGDAGT